MRVYGKPEGAMHGRDGATGPFGFVVATRAVGVTGDNAPACAGTAA